MAPDRQVLFLGRLCVTGIYISHHNNDDDDDDDVVVLSRFSLSLELRWSCPVRVYHVRKSEN